MSAEILIVEDDSSIQAVLRQILEIEGYSIATADNGEEALDVLASLDPVPKLILLDLMMPVMTGWEFAQLVQKNELWAKIPLVVLSAFEDKTEGISAAAVLTKPIEIDALLEIGHRFCRSKI
jgi:two-component system chemotaxis response regulator CheY